MDVKTQSLGPPPPAVQSARASDGWGGFVWFIIKLLLAVLAFRVFVFSPFSIPSESMLPRLMNGDYLLAAKWPYGFSRHSLPFALPLPEGRILARTPARGDIVIFKHPVDGRDYIKRVIGLPGDSVGVTGGQIILNGQRIARTPIDGLLVPQSPNTGCEWGGDLVATASGGTACRYAAFRERLGPAKAYEVLDFGTTQGDAFTPVTVPGGALFVMGDNRDNSRDSRFAAEAGDGVGLVPMDRLVGRAAIIIWSTDGSADLARPWTWISATRWHRIGDLL